jgi:hypothetical protein
MNQDSKIDLVVGYAKGGSRVFLNDGSGIAFEEVPFGDSNGAVYGIALGDVNADGKLDIAQGRSEATNTVFLNLGKVGS